MRQIIIACTLRKFKKNDYLSKLQIEFLKSLNNQTYKNFILVVTNFDNFNFKNYLSKFNFRFKIVKSKNIDIIKRKKAKFSFSETIIHASKLIQKNKSILLHTNVEVVFENNFFEEIINNFEPNSSIYSFPNLQFRNLKELKKNQFFDIYRNKTINNFYFYNPNKYITETIAVDGDLIIKNRKILEKFKKCIGTEDGYSKTIKPGFLAKTKKNIFFKSKIKNISHSYDPLSINHILNHSDFEIRKKNNKIYLSFYKYLNLNKFFYDSSIRRILINNEFKVVGKLSYKTMFFIYYKFYFILEIIKKLFLKIQNNIHDIILHNNKKHLLKYLKKEINKISNGRYKNMLNKKKNEKLLEIIPQYVYFQEKAKKKVLPLQNKYVLNFILFKLSEPKNYFNHKKFKDKLLSNIFNSFEYLNSNYNKNRLSRNIFSIKLFKSYINEKI